jgi:hypothetical protein
MLNVLPARSIHLPKRRPCAGLGLSLYPSAGRDHHSGATRRLPSSGPPGALLTFDDMLFRVNVGLRA